MAGTDTSQGSDQGPGAGPVIILVEAQLGENIGSAARAMLNCGLEDLRLVRPRDGWPNARAEAASSGALDLLPSVTVFETLEEAVSDLHRLYATTARHRDMVKPVVTPRGAAREMHRFQSQGQRCGILFGPERIGLLNDQVVLADALLTVPLNPSFSSLNLGQAVLLVAYEWLRNRDRTVARQVTDGGHAAASREQIQGFFEHLEKALDKHRFFKTPELRPTMVRNLRNIFQRAGLRDQEVRVLHGVVAALTGKRKDQL